MKTKEELQIKYERKNWLEKEMRDVEIQLEFFLDSAQKSPTYANSVCRTRSERINLRREYDQLLVELSELEKVAAIQQDQELLTAEQQIEAIKADAEATITPHLEYYVAEYARRLNCVISTKNGIPVFKRQ